jgi:chromosome partitioning protein
MPQVIPKTVSLINFKGGVGKTTLTWCLGDYLSRVEKKRILLFDCDAQMSLTSSIQTQEDTRPGSRFKDWLEKTEQEKTTILDALDKHILNQKKRVSVKDLSIYEINDKYHFVPSAENLYWMSLEGKYSKSIVRSFIDILIGGINNDETRRPYDFVLFDCPPNFTPLSYSILANCDLVIVPVNPDFYAIKGVEILTKVLQLFVKPLRVPNTAVFINKAKTNNQYQLTSATNDIGIRLNKLCNELSRKKAINIKFISQPILERVAIKNSVTGSPIPNEIIRDIQKLWEAISKEFNCGK